MQADFLVPFLFAYTLFAFEGIDTAHTDIDVWQTHLQCGVFGSLGDRHIGTNAPWAIGETLCVVYGTTGSVFSVGLHVVITVDIAAVIATGLEVYARGEVVVWIGFAILCMSPLYAEVLCHVVVWHVLFARNIPTVVKAEVSAKLITFGIHTACRYRPCSTCVNVSREFEVYIVVDGEYSCSGFPGWRALFPWR